MVGWIIPTLPGCSEIMFRENGQGEVTYVLPLSCTNCITCMLWRYSIL